MKYLLFLMLLSSGCGAAEDKGRDNAGTSDIDYFSVTWKGQRYNIGTEGLKYNSSHHNWFDSLEARSDTASFDWDVEYRNEVTPEFIHSLSGKVGTDVLEKTVMDVECENCGYFRFVLDK